LSGTAPRDRCYHCGEALPTAAPQRVFEGESRRFCCNGCAAAAGWIHDAQLGDYYRLRSEEGGRVALLASDLSAWDREEVQQGHAREVPGGREITLVTNGMRCAACAWLIDRALRQEPGILEVSANAITGRIRLLWDPAVTRLSQPLQRLAALGYRPGLARGEAVERARRVERRRWLLRLGLAGLASLQAMMFAEALYFDVRGQMPLPTRDFLRWITFLISTPVVFYAGWPFLEGAWRECRGRRLGMDTLVASGMLLAWGGSVIETLRGGPQVWYDTAVMFVFLLLLARLLEQRARAMASAQVDTLAQACPALATRERPDGSSETVPLARLAVGDIARVAAGDALPADGQLLEAPASFSEALLTGESRAVTRQPGTVVYAGTLCLDQPVRLRVTGIGPATRLSTLTRLVEQAQAHRPRVARLADQVAGWFVLALLFTAVLVYARWHFTAPERAFEVLLCVLVISCPCALSLSVPAALAAAHGYLARIGVLATRPDALEALAQATDLVFDKTGTLSTGQMEIASISTHRGSAREEALALAAALERDSRHPIASAFTEVPITRTATGVQEYPGQGIEGEIESRRLRLGTAPFAAGRGDDGALWLGDGEQPLARFELRETARSDSGHVLAQLSASGLRLHLYSGDDERTVATFAARFGLADFAGRLSPADKLDRVRTLQAQGRIVAMVGDGLNDAPVLAGANVSFVMAEGAPLAQQAADFVLTQASLQRVPDAVALARRTQRIIQQNLAWAVGYNLLALPLAATGQVTPWMAALAMVVSSLTVTLNALRLTRAGPA
jgi:Cu2+-exporting ATPase